MDMWLTALLWCVGGAIAVWIVVTLFRTRKPIRGLLGSTLQGACALAAVNVTGMFTGVSLGLNLFSTITCAVLGVPGVITLLLVKVILGV